MGRKGANYGSSRAMSKALPFSARGKVYCVKGTASERRCTARAPRCCTSRTAACAFDYKNRRLSYTHVKTNPGPNSAEDRKPPDVRIAGIDAANAAKSQSRPSARKGADNAGLRYSAMGARSGPRYPALPKSESRAQKGHSHVAVKGNILMLR